MPLQLQRLESWISNTKRLWCRVGWIKLRCRNCVRYAVVARRILQWAVIASLLSGQPTTNVFASGKFANTTAKPERNQAPVIRSYPLPVNAANHTPTPVLILSATPFVAPSPTANSGPTKVLVRVSWYDPALCHIKPINCKEVAYWWNMGDGKNATEWYDRALACPKGYYGRTFLIDGLYGPRTCYDGGGQIFVEDDGVIRVDVLTQHPIVT